MNNYETVFIMNPVLSDEQMRETVKKFTKTLKDHKAKIGNEEYWGLKKLKYAIQKKNTGFYYFIEFTHDVTSSFSFLLALNLFLLLSAYAMEYLSKRTVSHLMMRSSLLN